MNRRTFLKSTAAVSLTAGATLTGCASAAGSARDYYEWRTYRLNPGGAPVAHQFLKEVALPAWKKAGVGPVGVFTDETPEEAEQVHVLLTYRSPDQVTTAWNAVLEAGDAGQGHAFLGNPPFNQSPYERMDNALLLAFEAMPKLERPIAGPRILEVRRYFGATERAVARKVQMFNEGEIAIFRECGMQPVFFGQSLVSGQSPYLQYAIAYADHTEREKVWNAFRVHPEWLRMKALPEYTGTVSGSKNVFLLPTEYSEI